MQQSQIVVVLFLFVALLVVLAQKLRLPYPVLLVIGGLGLSFVPRLPELRLNPDLVFFFILPPLLYPAALFTSWRDFRRHLRAILLLAVGLVLATALVVAWIAHGIIPGLPWAAAFALGAIVSPPDAVAATAVMRRLAVPQRLESLLEAESLVNDATALVALQFAVGALLTGRFSIGHAALQFAWVGAGGIAFGLAVGCVARWVQRHLDDPPVQVTISLLTPFVAYLPAEQLHVSGVLATVAAGIYMGWHGPLMITARTRLQAQAFWEVLVFLLNGFVFVVIGLQLPGILRALHGEPFPRLAATGALISGAVVLVRIAWVVIAMCLPRLLSRKLRAREPRPPWRDVALISWSGMRGVISLAAAFALPFALADGSAFPARSYILFVTFCVILTTLVVQGLSLPLLIRAIGLKDDGQADDEERQARLEANQTALRLLESDEVRDGVPAEIVQRLRAEYEDRLAQLEACCGNPENPGGAVATEQYQRLQRRALTVEREAIIRLRNAHVINDHALRRIQRDLDLAEARLLGD